MNKYPKTFIHIQKAGGMTIRHAAYTGPLKGKVRIATKETHISPEYSENVLKTMNKYGDHHGFEHVRWREVHPRFKKNGCFALIRNPWDRVVSRYFFAKKVIEVEKKVPKSYADVSSFEAFLEERHKWGNIPYMWHRAVRGWYPAFEHVCDDEGNVPCDILRVEYLNQDIEAYFNIKQMSRPRNVTALNKGTYRDLYTENTIQIIADWYKKDIEYWGFDFDTPATRNYWVKDEKLR